MSSKQNIEETVRLAAQDPIALITDPTADVNLKAVACWLLNLQFQAQPEKIRKFVANRSSINEIVIESIIDIFDTNNITLSRISIIPATDVMINVVGAMIKMSSIVQE